MNPTIKISTSLNILRLCLALFCIEHTISQKTESLSSTLLDAITLENFLFSYLIVNFQMGNQVTVTQMHFLNVVCSILRTYYVHFKKALITPLKMIHKGEQFIHIHMGLWT
jgi:L-cystine uptake protein TcyP (sodium:dicarboxylate symporter family)